jgi:ABC-type transport system involved in multi-copper enzyme maturation permease subunit
MSTVDDLCRVLDFKREAVGQLPVASTLLAGIAMAGVALLLSSTERGRLRSYLVTMFSIATLVFVFATILSVTIIAPMKHASTSNSPEHLAGLIRLSRIAVWSMLVGILTLFASIGCMGYLFSPRVGRWIVAMAMGVLLVFAACAVYLDQVMRL